MTDLLGRLQAALGDAYRIERELGGGGMSRVFLADEASLHRQVVIKVLPPELASDVSEARFKQEIELAAHLQHPNILQVLAAGAKDDLLYYVMPFVSGESLRHRLTREGKLPVVDAVRILSEVADALAYAHAEGVIHRDIKPENILLLGTHAVLMDFGVARALAEARSGERLTETGLALGTPGYMSPEQAAGERHVDARADVYALAVVGYEMLAGVPPFAGPTAQAVIAAHLTATPQPLGDIRPETPPEVSNAIARALAKDPNARLRTAAEFRDALAVRRAPVTPAFSVLSRRTALIGGAVILVILAVYGVFARMRTQRATAGASPHTMLVVLPFANLGSPEEEYFADGITEEITARLAALHGLGVISRTSAVHYKKTDKALKQIGQELHVHYVLEGTIRWERSADGASRVRVTPQLIRVSDDTHLWADVYDEAMADVFKVQSSIAARVASALDVALLEPEQRALEAKPTENLEAYGYYLRGNDYYNRSYEEEGNLRSAIAMYEKATSLDPTFALAYAKLAIAHNQLYWFSYDRSDERLAASQRAAERALQLDPDLPEGHVALGVYYYHGRYDYARALEQFALAQQRQPNSSDVWASIGAVERRQGKWEQAVADWKKATELDPRSNDYVEELGETYEAMGDYRQAESLYSKAQSLAPDWPYIYCQKAQLYLVWDGSTKRARQVLDDGAGKAATPDLLGYVVARCAGLAFVRLLNREDPERLGRLSLRAVGGDTAAYFLTRAVLSGNSGPARVAAAYYDSARIVLERRIRNQPGDPLLHATLGYSYAGLGRKAEAIREGKRAVALLPRSKDAYAGPSVVESLAEIDVMVGEYEAALDQLASIIAIPAGGPLMVWTDPIWDPLRANPRFERLLQAQAPRR